MTLLAAAVRGLTPPARRHGVSCLSAAGGGRASAAVEQKKAHPASTEKLDLAPPRGTRDVYPEDMRVRNWLFGKWRSTAKAFGFEEYDAPVLENEALYVRKAGEEVTQQLYNFEDKGGRRVALRPEMTPSLARMVMARKPTPPLKWFSIPQCWRYERTTRGRRREHYQWNMDIWGVDAAAEAEALAAMVSFMERVGLTSDDVGIKVNSRAVLAELLARTCGVDAAADAARFAACCVLVDKLEKVPPEALHGDFGALGVAAADVDALAAVLRDAADAGGSLAALEALIGDGPALSNLRALVDLAEAGGFGDWIVVDASVVRGLAYYTGVVFEAFDRQGALRAIAGGGRYDRLLETFGGDPLPAVGFGFGDAVIMELLEEKKLVPSTSSPSRWRRATATRTPRPSRRSRASRRRCDRALLCVQIRRRGAPELWFPRRSGALVDVVLEPKKPKWAFKHADRRNAKAAVMLAPSEWAEGRLVAKDLKTGDQADIALEELAAWVGARE